MKKAVLFLFFSSNIIYIAAQENSLKANFRKQAEFNQAKFQTFLQNNTKNYTDAQIKDMQSRLAGFAGDIPVFLQPDDIFANSSANVPGLQNGTLEGLSGLNVDGTGIQILVMDGGRVQDTHNDFKVASGDPARVVNIEASTVEKSSHATNVTSIILGNPTSKGTVYWSDGSSNKITDAKGVLPKASSINYYFGDTDLGNNYDKLAAATDANISNHSYGINVGWAYKDTPTKGWYWIGNLALNSEDTYSGAYNTQDANFDKIVYSNPNHIVVKSAGNYYGYGPNADKSLPTFKWSGTAYIPFEDTDVLPPENCSQGYNCIGWGSLAKNIIVVGATYQLETENNQYTGPEVVEKADFSSAGPRKDGAIKPDLSAVGVSIFSAGYDSTKPSANNIYSKGSGTSYSAPVISGIAGALTQIERNLSGNSSFTFKADEMKALLTHTANEAGNPGPDVWYGWGFADATNAAEVLIEKKAGTALLERKTLTSGTPYSFTVTAKSGEALKVSLSWIDPAAVPFTTDSDMQNNHTSRLVNDLDLRIVDTTDNTVYYPWKLDIVNPMAYATKGDNTVDNIEQVIIDTPVAGRTYRIEVSNKGQLVNDKGQKATQDFALLATGYNTISLNTISADLNKVIAVYPTRTQGNVTVVVPVKATIGVFDMNGKSVLSVQAKGTQMIDLSHLPAGVYLVNIITEKGTVSKKIIKE
ncbi:S8 family peptidase [Weeksellaceae bacterium A-14]